MQEMTLLNLQEKSKASLKQQQGQQTDRAACIVSFMGGFSLKGTLSASGKLL